MPETRGYHLSGRTAFLALVGYILLLYLSPGLAFDLYTPVYDRAKYGDGFHPPGVTLRSEIVKELGDCLLEEGRGCQLILHPWWTAWE